MEKERQGKVKGGGGRVQAMKGENNNSHETDTQYRWISP